MGTTLPVATSRSQCPPRMPRTAHTCLQMDSRGWACRAVTAAGAAGADGPLAGLAFAAKDSYNVGGRVACPYVNWSSAEHAWLACWQANGLPR